VSSRDVCGMQRSVVSVFGVDKYPNEVVPYASTH